MAEQHMLIGTQVGHYRLTSLLGQGGFAEVYLGEHIHLHIPVAVKVLHTRLTNQDQQAFQQEAQMVARLQHPHIVRVFDFGIEQDFPYLVMDYAPAGTVRHAYSKGQQVPLQVVVQWTRQVAEALQFAHEQRIIHRDIKPENMLMGRQQEILLSDFGIAIALQTSRSHSTQNIAGTIAYMAPEQVQAHPTPASDQYSLGIVAYEWLSGQRPFQGSYTEIAVKHALVPPPPLRNSLPQLPQEVELVIMTALQKDPRRRFPSVLAFAQALDAAVQQSMSRKAFLENPLQTRTGPTAFSPYYPGPASVNMQQSAAFTPSASPITPPGYHAQAPGPNAPFFITRSTSLEPQTDASAAQNAQRYADSRPPAAPFLSPSTLRARGISRRSLLIGGGLAIGVLGMAAIGGLRARQNLSQALQSGKRAVPNLQNSLPPLSESNQTATRMLTGAQGYLLQVRMSPDGKYVAAGSMDGTAYFWSTEKDAPTLQVVSTANPAQSDNYPWSMDWSVNNHLVICFVSGNIQVIEPSSGKRLLDIMKEEHLVAQAIWSPTEQYLAISTTNNTVRVYSYPTMNIVSEYKDHTDSITALAWSPDGKYIASGSKDNKVKIWEPLTSTTRIVYNGHTDFITSLAWSPDSTRVASAASADDARADQYDLYIWKVATGITLGKYKRTGGAPMGKIRWSRTHDLIAVYNANAALDILDAQTAKTQHTLPTGVIYDMDWSLDDKQVITAGYNKHVAYWQIPS